MTLGQLQALLIWRAIFNDWNRDATAGGIDDQDAWRVTTRGVPLSASCNGLERR